MTKFHPGGVIPVVDFSPALDLARLASLLSRAATPYPTSPVSARLCWCLTPPTTLPESSSHTHTALCALLATTLDQLTILEARLR